MNSGIVKGFFKFYPGIFHKKRSFAGIFRVIGDGELVFCDSKGEVTLGKIKRGTAPRRSPLWTPHGFGEVPKTPRTMIIEMVEPA